MTSIGINAATGRMGRELLLAVSRDELSQIGAALVREEHQWAGQPLSKQFPGVNSDVVLADNLSTVAAKIDVLIDFSLPDFSVKTATHAAELGIPMVIGTTGFSYQQKQTIEALGQTIPVLMAPNMSVGVNVSLSILEKIAKAIGSEADIEVIEAHHRYKKDSPSGTALRMGEAIATGLGSRFSEIAAFDRCGKDALRKPGSIGFSAIRAGNIVGEHTVLFALAGEEIEIKHKAQDRQTFAQGAIRAARWLSQQAPGSYDMLDVLGMK